jgi:hypothetical protein
MSGKPDAPTSPTLPNPKQPTKPHLQIQPLTLLQKKSCAAPVGVNTLTVKTEDTVSLKTVLAETGRFKATQRSLSLFKWGLITQAPLVAACM